MIKPTKTLHLNFKLKDASGFDKIYQPISLSLRLYERPLFMALNYHKNQSMFLYKWLTLP
jgi:hypothetical protein